MTYISKYNPLSNIVSVCNYLSTFTSPSVSTNYNFHHHGDFHFVTSVVCNLVAPCIDGIVIIVAVCTSQIAIISCWSCCYMLEGKMLSRKVIAATDRSSIA